jgi:hypothetical protein
MQASFDSRQSAAGAWVDSRLMKKAKMGASESHRVFSAAASISVIPFCCKVHDRFAILVGRCMDSECQRNYRHSPPPLCRRSIE